MINFFRDYHDILSLIGLILDFIGVIILFKNHGKILGSGSIIHSDNEKIGFRFLIIGFLFQIIGSIIAFYLK